MAYFTLEAHNHEPYNTGRFLAQCSLILQSFEVFYQQSCRDGILLESFLENEKCEFLIFISYERN